MAEPIATSTTSAIALTGIGAVTLLSGLDAATVLGAFAGAAVFALNSGELTVLRKLAVLLLSIVAGCLSAPLAAALIASALPTNTEVSHGVGALVASAVLVKLLLALIRIADRSDQALRRYTPHDKGDRQ